jgi:hypothetical protein
MRSIEPSADTIPMLNLGYWISPRALERVSYVAALTMTGLAVAFVAIVICLP